MIEPLHSTTSVYKESFPQWKPFFDQFSHPVEEKQKKEIIESLTLEIARQIQHHLKKMKEHYKKLREEQNK